MGYLVNYYKTIQLLIKYPSLSFQILSDLISEIQALFIINHLLNFFYLRITE